MKACALNVISHQLKTESAELSTSQLSEILSRGYLLSSAMDIPNQVKLMKKVHEELPSDDYKAINNYIDQINNKRKPDNDLTSTSSMVRAKAP